MEGQKESAARQAAARFATDAVRAVEWYASLTGRSEQWSAGERDLLEEEMLSLLPAYRHPVHDVSTEYILFIDPSGLPLAETSSDQEGNEEAGETSGWGGQAGRFRQERAYLAYVKLVRGKGLSRREAVDTVAALFGFSSVEATLQMLRAQQEEALRRWQKSAPCLAETILSRWRGLLPRE